MYRAHTTVASVKPGCSVDTRCRYTRHLQWLRRTRSLAFMWISAQRVPDATIGIAADFRIKELFVWPVFPQRGQDDPLSSW